MIRDYIFFQLHFCGFGVIVLLLLDLRRLTYQGYFQLEGFFYLIRGLARTYWSILKNVRVEGLMRMVWICDFRLIFFLTIFFILNLVFLVVHEDCLSLIGNAQVTFLVLYFLLLKVQEIEECFYNHWNFSSLIVL